MASRSDFSPRRSIRPCREAGHLPSRGTKERVAARASHQMLHAPKATRWQREGGGERPGRSGGQGGLCVRWQRDARHRACSADLEGSPVGWSCAARARFRIFGDRRGFDFSRRRPRAVPSSGCTRVRSLRKPKTACPSGQYQHHRQWPWLLHKDTGRFTKGENCWLTRAAPTYNPIKTYEGGHII